MQQELAGGLQGHLDSLQEWGAAATHLQRLRDAFPCGADMSPLAGAATLTQEGLLGSPRAQKVVPSHLFLIISIFQNYPGGDDIDREARAIARGV